MSSVVGVSGDFDVQDQAAYDALQAKLVSLWSSIDHLNTDPQTIVVVPSADIDVELPPDVLQAYEERYLFLLLLLRQPRAEIVYLTGQPILPEIVDYYVDLMPGSSHLTPAAGSTCCRRWRPRSGHCHARSSNGPD